MLSIYAHNMHAKMYRLISKQVLKYLSLALFIYTSSTINATAHNVVGGAYVDGQTIEGEIGFSNGDMALPDTLVEAFNDAGKKLGETKTLQEGIFIYPVKQLVTHIFKADLSAGHVIEITVEADELNAPIKSQLDETQPDTNNPTNLQIAMASNSTKASGKASDNTTINLTPQALEQLISSTVRQAVAKQVKPLQKDLRAYKEKVMLRDIAGGIGFILGIFGIAAWMASRKQPTSSVVAKP